MVKNIIFCYEGETHVGNDSGRKQHFLHHKKHNNNKEVYRDGSKSTGRKLSFAAVFADINRRRILPEEASIHAAEMTAMREIQKSRIRNGQYI